MTEERAKNLTKRITASIIAILLLTAALSVTTFILVVSMISTDGHIFSTGNVAINLNDGKPVISGDDALFEPGATFERPFTIENLSSCDVWYKFYFENADSELASHIEVSIKDGDKLLANGKLNELTYASSRAIDNTLAAGEKKSLTICFHLEEDTGNDMQEELLSFDFSVKAVQAKNNPDRNFD